ncbi:MAG: 23S rRNA (uracil(1939)-C(5))-methyltransferase RlmD [Pseudomonadaceae bacterium]|nr:23S rRNA (uracil(1939)-C(5))-methyltransferase RlmD [Pseudomonadaceae bacterium]
MARYKFPQHFSVLAGELGRDGLATAEFEGRPVQIKNGLPGEQVEVRTVGVKRRKALVEAQAWQPANPERVEPACKHFPRCGGCTLAHVDPVAQLASKRGWMLAELAAAGVEPARVRDDVAGPLMGYRTKARLGVRKIGEQVLVGFRESFSSRVARLDACMVLSEPFSGLLPALSELIGSLTISADVPQLELAAGDPVHGNAAIIVRHLAPLAISDIERLQAFEQRYAIRLWLQAKGPDTVVPLTDARDLTSTSSFRSDGQLLLGNPDFGLNLLFHPSAFTQVNLAINRSLVREALISLKLRAGVQVSDLFCGIGNFTLPIARSGARVFGVEASAPAIAQARKNAAANSVDCEFAVADLYSDAVHRGSEHAGEEQLRRIRASERLLLDPPRSGAGPNLAGWLGPNLSTLVYVSCNPVSLAEDAAVLNSNGFDLASVGVFDMFPHTTHVETLAVFNAR